MSAETEIKRLADYLLAEWSDEPGRGDPRHGELAVDVAIRLLTRYKAKEDGYAMCGICGDAIGEGEDFVDDAEVGEAHTWHYEDAAG